MRAPAVARSYRFLVEAVGDYGWRVVQQTACWEGQGDCARRPIFASGFDNVDQLQVGVGRRRRVIGAVEAKKRPRRRSAGRQRRSLGLQGGACRLKLKSVRREAGPKRKAEFI